MKAKTLAKGAAKSTTTQKNIDRVTRPDVATRVYIPGQNASPPAVSKPESDGLAAEGDARRAEYEREEGKTRQQLSAERARQGREEGASGQIGRDAASSRGGSGT